MQHSHHERVPRVSVHYENDMAKDRRINGCHVYWGAFVRRASLAARLIHPWDEPMGVCTRKRATVLSGETLSPMGRAHGGLYAEEGDSY